MIAAGTVDGALRGISKYIPLKGGLADFFGDGGFFGERLARGFVFDELDGLQEAEAAHLADVGMSFERREGFPERFACGRDSVEKLVGLEAVEDSVACRGGNGMRLIGEAVHEGGAARFERIDDVRSDKDRAERSVPTGDSLSGENNVGLKPPVLAGEWFTSASHARHDFVGDEQDAVAAADLGDACGVAVDGGNGAERGANDWLKDERGYGGGVVGAEKNFEVISTG